MRPILATYFIWRGYLLMKRVWNTEELVEHWTLMPPELELPGNKSGATRLGFALLLKFFQHEACFPKDANEIPDTVISYVAKQVGAGCWGVTEQETRLRMLELVRNSALFAVLVSCEGGNLLAKLRSFARLGCRTDLQVFSCA
jgi:hypothetical protein